MTRMDTLASAFHPMKLLFHSALVVVGFALVPLVQAQTAAPAKPGDLVNGDFSMRTGNGLPTGWSFTTTPWISARGKDPQIPDGITVATLPEGSKTIVRITYKDNRDGCLVQVVDVPPRAKEARFKVAVRGEPEVEGGRMAFPDAGFRFFNAAGKFLPDSKTQQAPKQLSDKSWREVEFKCDVPPGAVFCNVILGNTNKSNGTFDFRGASVRFR